MPRGAAGTEAGPGSRIARRRLAAQHLTRAPFDDVVAVVRAQGAVQAQDYAAAKWALGLRCTSATDASVDGALADGTIIRTHVLRPTWHFVAPADLRWMLRLTADRIRAVMAPYDRRLGLGPATIARSNTILERLLRDGAHATRARITAALVRAGVPTATPRISHLLLRAELDAVVCSGPRQGKQFTYALFDERVPEGKAFDRDEALHELTTRYFATRSPATAHDFAWWSGLTLGDARRGIESAGRAIRRETIGDMAYWSAADAPRPGTRSPVAHLLPNYDEYFIGHRHRGAILERVKEFNGANMNALGAHVIHVDGQIVGGWTRAVKRQAVMVELTPVVPLAPEEREAVVEAARRYAAFLELQPVLSWTKTPASRRARKVGWQSGVLR